MAAAQEYPGDYCCDIYPEKNYTGDVVSLCIEDYGKYFYAYDYQMSYGMFDMKSFSCGAKVEYCFIGCRSNKGSSGAGAGMNPEVQLEFPGAYPSSSSDVWIEHYDDTSNVAVTVYAEKDCKG